MVTDAAARTTSRINIEDCPRQVRVARLVRGPSDRSGTLSMYSACTVDLN
jgi:hypothetical protein